jgi:hypothetical protein
MLETGGPEATIKLLSVGVGTQACSNVAVHRGIAV